MGGLVSRYWLEVLGGWVDCRALVTFGITPTAPLSGYGYIQAAEPGAMAPARKVRRFVEKPSPEVAQRFIEDGSYYWNSGMFAFQASVFLAELERLAPRILEQVRAAVAAGQRADDSLQHQALEGAQLGRGAQIGQKGVRLRSRLQRKQGVQQCGPGGVGAHGAFHYAVTMEQSTCFPVCRAQNGCKGGGASLPASLSALS